MEHEAWKSRRDDSMVEKRIPPLLFRAKEWIHSEGNKISRGGLVVYATYIPNCRAYST